MKLRRKFIFGMILLVFLPVIVVGAFSYSLFSDVVEKKSSSYYGLSLQDTDRKLKYAFNEINTVTDLAVTQPAIQQVLRNPPVVVTNELAQTLSGLIMLHPRITSFSIYSMSSLVYQTKASTLTESFTELKQEPWYGKMLRLSGRPLWIGPGENGTGSTGNPTLIQARVIKDYYSLKNIGVLLVTVKPDILEQVFWEAPTLKQGDILLVNQEGSVVYSKSGSQVGDQISFSFLKDRDASAGKGYVTQRFSGEESLITYSPSFNDGWTLIAVTSLARLQAESDAIRSITVATVMFLLLTAFLFDKYFVSRLVQTIVKTVRGLKDVERGSFREITLRHQSRDESGMLVEGFNGMSRRIRELLRQVETEQERKKEAELQALVAQINPHFIYNSLESINSLAVLQGNKDISRMVVSLGKLLRISISENQELIPLSMEIEHVKHYLNIQKYRFEDKFDYDIQLPTELKLMRTQKLIIQPIVENALYHGIEPMEGKGTIRVAVHEGESCLWIEIADNGPGFELDRLGQVWSEEPRERKKYKDSGVGLKNVHERLRLRFGYPYGLMVCSAPEQGTVIRLRIPKISNPGGLEDGDKGRNGR